MSANKTFCPDCGTHGKGARFCAECGAALGDAALAPSVRNGDNGADALTTTAVLPITVPTMPAATQPIPTLKPPPARREATRTSLAKVSTLVGTSIGSALVVIAATGLMGYW